ncbi:cysteine hydrolase family protein [Planomonospora sp. ID82291]|uniref:cysteine hydrolase family protein n=1 Tax=Planomonospora sp. ID82291 TaxID=2738136 RepID=UPI0018C3E8C4|nr:isochorismatase family cysteine hydrolase [Planomonospora sp. ID82291]MBG0817718.1 cysteine hydrolase [Planomonospora sp. ID82291]
MSTAALIVMDMLNPYDHRDADLLAESVGRIVEPLAGLIGRAHGSEDVALVFVNDNHGDFTATRDDIAALALKGRRPELVEPVLPPDDAPFLAKVRHSGFYGTSLEYLLNQRGVETVILAGQVTEQCVLYSALDAYVRHFSIRVPRDCVAHIHPDLGEAALRMMERNMGAQIVGSDRCLSG